MLHFHLSTTVAGCTAHPRRAFSASDIALPQPAYLNSSFFRTPAMWDSHILARNLPISPLCNVCATVSLLGHHGKNPLPFFFFFIMLKTRKNRALESSNHAIPTTPKIQPVTIVIIASYCSPECAYIAETAPAANSSRAPRFAA